MDLTVTSLNGKDDIRNIKMACRSIWQICKVAQDSVITWGIVNGKGKAILVTGRESP
jgi:hypothetical protein